MKKKGCSPHSLIIIGVQVGSLFHSQRHLKKKEKAMNLVFTHKLQGCALCSMHSPRVQLLLESKSNEET
jgi:hypothetical protein